MTSFFRRCQAMRLSSPPMPAGSPIVTANGALFISGALSEPDINERVPTKVAQRALRQALELFPQKLSEN